MAAALGARVVALEPQPAVLPWLERRVGRMAGVTIRAEATPAEIDFTIERGQTVARVGRSGARNSTLISLLPRLYEGPEVTGRVTASAAQATMKAAPA